MSNSESDGPSDNDWEDRGELAWNEFDWEKYLRGQDEVLQRYVKLYDKSAGRADRIDHVAQGMGWDEGDWSSEEDSPDVPANPANDGAEAEDSDPYTLLKNPIFIATKAIYLTLQRDWEKAAIDPTKLPQRNAVLVAASLNRGEQQATLAIQALDFGDYAMAISLLKRALRELNLTFSLLGDRSLDDVRALTALRDVMIPRLFDLREIWLRVMAECRDELDRPVEDEDTP
jgi:hypothetical protein